MCDNGLKISLKTFLVNLDLKKKLVIYDLKNIPSTEHFTVRIYSI